MIGEAVTYNCTSYYLKKPHNCFSCGCILEKKRREAVVHSNSPEAKNYDFGIGDTYLVGYVRFITFYFQCPSCGRSYEIRELINLEREQKRKEKKGKKKKWFKWF
ncbi:MAG: hypothetical protein IJB96_08370 [Lachnospira sp.]|nr:hypothetical protein [Lachnospira sp.]